MLASRITTMRFQVDESQFRCLCNQSCTKELHALLNLSEVCMIIVENSTHEIPHQQNTEHPKLLTKYVQTPTGVIVPHRRHGDTHF